MRKLLLIALIILSKISFCQQSDSKSKIDDTVSNLEILPVFRAEVITNTYKNIYDPSKNDFETGKYTTEFFVDSNKELVKVININVADITSDVTIAVYYYSNKNLIKAEFHEITQNGKIVSPLNEYYYQNNEFVLMNERYPSKGKRFYFMVFTNGIEFRNQYYSIETNNK